MGFPLKVRLYKPVSYWLICSLWVGYRPLGGPPLRAQIAPRGASVEPVDISRSRFGGFDS
jgi:hypothetical protein